MNILGTTPTLSVQSNITTLTRLGMLLLLRISLEYEKGPPVTWLTVSCTYLKYVLALVYRTVLLLGIINSAGGLIYFKQIFSFHVSA